MSNNSIDLHQLYNKNENSECKGCTILDIRKPFHCHKDYEGVKPVDVLFITDSYRYNGWAKEFLSEQENDFFNEAILPLLGSITYAFTPAIKCPSVKDQEIGAKNSKICRKYLFESVKNYSPKLIIPLGNLAFKMLTKKSGITKYHGTEFRYEDIPVVPTYNISIIFMEPKYLDNIVRDVEIALTKFIHKEKPKISDFDYKLVEHIIDWKMCFNKILNFDGAISFDIESTGLNFLTDKVLTLAISFNDGRYNNYCIPIFHKESIWSESEIKDIIGDLKVLGKRDNVKILQNAKFDLRMLAGLGIEFINVWDTKGMAHLVDEYQHLGLKDLVKRFLPNSLEFL